MIELLWKDIYDKEFDPYTYVVELIAWLSTTIAEQAKNHSLFLTSTILVRESDDKISTLILCDGEKGAEKHMLEILQQPPDSYKGKYVPCILSEEPSPVTEKNEEDEELEIILDSDDEKT